MDVTYEYEDDRGVLWKRYTLTHLIIFASILIGQN